MILSVMASLVSFTALGRVEGLVAIFWRTSLFSLKNFSMLSLSLIIRSVMISLRSAESAPALLSVLADEADYCLSECLEGPSASIVSVVSLFDPGILTFLRLD
jgi:hypothetical protein